METLLTSVHTMKLAVVSRLKEDFEKFNNKGGKLTSSVDGRISLVIPKRAIRFTTVVGMKVTLL